MSIMHKLKEQEKKVNPGSKHKEFLHEVIKKELELQLKRSISSEDDFRHACLDYLSIEPGFHPMPPELRGHKIACYSCLQTAHKPQVIIVDNVVVSLHMECISGYVVKYLAESPFSNFIAPKAARQSKD